MVNIQLLFDSLKNLGVDFFTGVPDSFLNNFCLYLVQNFQDCQHVMAANEGNAIAIAASITPKPTFVTSILPMKTSARL